MMPSPKPPAPVLDEAFLEWLRAWPCDVCVRVQVGQPVPAGSEAVHVRTRKHGGDPGNAVPGCRAHHDRLHRWGQPKFEAHYRINLKARALWYWKRYRQEQAKRVTPAW